MATASMRVLMVEPLAQNGSRPHASRAFAAIQNHRGALRRRQVVAGLDLGQAGGKVSQPGWPKSTTECWTNRPHMTGG